MQRLILSSVFALLFVTPVLAHPVPKTNRDRIIVVRVTAAALIVDYRLELDEGSIPEELTTDERAGITTRDELLRAFTKSFANTTCRTLDASLDGQELKFQCVQRNYTASDHVRCDYRFESRWSLASDLKHLLKFHDTNYISDDFSRIHLYLAADDGVRLLSAKAPSVELMERSSDYRKPGDGNRLRRAEATFNLTSREALAIAKPSIPPDNLTWKSEPDSIVSTAKPSASRAEWSSKAAPSLPIADSKPGQSESNSPVEAIALPTPPETPDASGESTVVEPPSLWVQISKPNVLMNLLLDSRAGLALLLLIAALAGAAHALTPGHGKTLVAAYLVGQRGTYWHAILLGIITTLTHTGAVIVLAAGCIALGLNMDAALALLELAGGFLIAGLGLWLLMRRLTGQVDHIHLGGGHHHHHHGLSDPNLSESLPGVAAPSQKSRFWEVIVLGMAGGMIPCVDAVILFVFAVSAGQVRLALPLLLAFSAGLAFVLIVLGLAVVGAKRVAQLATPSSSWLEKLARPLPIFSALFVMLMGLWLCYAALNS